MSRRTRTRGTRRTHRWSNLALYAALAIAASQIAAPYIGSEPQPEAWALVMLLAAPAATRQ